MINTGHGVTLAPVLAKQMGQMLVWRNDRRVWKWCRQNSVISEMAHENWFRSLATNPKIRMFSVIKDDGMFVGVCGLTDIDHINSRAEVSLYIGPEFQRQGLGKAALQTLCDHAFYDLNLFSVWGESFHGSPANDLAFSCGFHKDGTRRGFYFREGVHLDAHLYSLVRGEETWHGQHLS